MTDSNHGNVQGKIMMYSSHGIGVPKISSFTFYNNFLEIRSTGELFREGRLIGEDAEIFSALQEVVTGRVPYHSLKDLVAVSRLCLELHEALTNLSHVRQYETLLADARMDIARKLLVTTEL